MNESAPDSARPGTRSPSRTCHDAEVRRVAAEHGIAYTAYSALASGVLTGKYRRDQAPPPESLVEAGYLDPVHPSLHDALDRLRATAEDRETTPGALALAWLLARPDVAAISTAPSRTRPHLSLVAEALRLHVSTDDAAVWSSWFLDAASAGEPPT